MKKITQIHGEQGRFTETQRTGVPSREPLLLNTCHLVLGPKGKKWIYHLSRTGSLMHQGRGILNASERDKESVRQRLHARHICKTH